MKKEKEKRDVAFAMRMTWSDRKYLDRVAAEMGLSASSAILELLHRSQERETQREFLLSVLKEFWLGKDA